ncbi:hypothetical protein [Priestia megaterium]|nr:hypothetical protein [Priestia megaterium]
MGEVIYAYQFEEGSLTPKESAGIQKEKLRLKQELDILKKAMAIFVKK